MVAWVASCFFKASSVQAHILDTRLRLEVVGFTHRGTPPTLVAVKSLPGAESLPDVRTGRGSILSCSADRLEISQIGEATIEPRFALRATAQRPGTATECQQSRNETPLDIECVGGFRTQGARSQPLFQV